MDRPVTDGLGADLRLDVGGRVSLVKVDIFCCLGDMLDADGGCSSAVTARVGSAWKKFREYLPILTGKGFSLRLKGKVCAACVGVVWCMAVGPGLWGLGAGRDEKLGELLGLEPVGLMVGGVGWDGLDVLSEGVAVTGSGIM